MGFEDRVDWFDECEICSGGRKLHLEMTWDVES